MKTIETLFQQLGTHHIMLKSDGDRLVVKAPKGAMTKELSDQIKTRKAELLAYLWKVQRQQKPISPAPLNAPLLLSSSQKRLWFLDQLEQANHKSGHYNLFSAIRLQGWLNIPCLQEALNALVTRHQPLRTRFHQKSGKPFAVISPQANVVIHVLESKPEQDLDQWIQATTRKPFDLEQDALLRLELVQLAHNEHLLVLTMHHIISDGWSMGILVQELLQLYQANSQQRPNGLKPLPLQYSDYAYWQHSQEHTQEMARHTEWWKSYLADLPPIHQVPIDFPRPEVDSHQGAHLHRLLSLALAQRVEAFAKAEGVTPYMVLLAVFKILLYRYSNQQDLAIGTPVANRERQELEPLIGFFVNTVVIRSRVNPQLSFRDFLHQIRQQALACFARQEVAFEDVVDALNPERNLSHSPLFQIMFSMQNAPSASLNIPNLKTCPVRIEVESAKFDLTLDATITSKGLNTIWEYKTALFRPATIATFANHYQRLLHQVLESATTSIHALHLLSVEEEQALRAQWKPNPIVNRQLPAAHKRFETIADQFPDRIAVVSASEKMCLSFDMLNRRANQLATTLSTSQIGRDTCVGLMLDRSPELIIAMLAVLKAGGAYVPLDPSLPIERLEFMVRDCQPKLVLGLSRGPLALNQSHPFLSLDDPSSYSQNTANPDRAVHPEQAAYFIYTSGSTGQPKASVNRQIGLTHLIDWQQQRFPLQADDRVALKTPFSFDVATFEIFWPLLAGAGLVITQQGRHGDPFYLKTWMQRQAITAIHFVGSMLQAFLVSLGEQIFYSKLRVLFTGGEALPPEVIPLTAKLLRGEQGKQLAIENGYGPSEAAVFVTHSQLPSSLEACDPPIGRPVGQTQAYVVDPFLNLVPQGVAGELVLTGPHLARGYHQKPHVTADRFVPNPFSTDPMQSRVYRTGDLVRQRPDGQLAFLGRLDHQVKLRGLRIELGEIEAVIRHHDHVQLCIVVVGKTQAGEDALIAFIQSDPSAPASLFSTIQASLHQQLPNYMVPAKFVAMDSWPSLPNGKINRQALANQAATFVFGQASDTTYVPPNTPLEAALVDIWETILQTKPIGVLDNFFDRGGHSLLATQVVSRIREDQGVDVPLTAFFKRPNVAGLADWMTTNHNSTHLPPIIATSSKWTSAPLSFAQQRLWFLHQLLESEQASTGLYNIHTRLELKGDICSMALQSALTLLAQRHDVLRTYFASENGKPIQIVVPQSQLKVEVLDARHFSEQDLLQRIQTEAQFAFRLDKPQLLRMVLLKLDDTHTQLLLTMHHIISDGWSIHILVDELLAFYQQALGGQTAALAQLAIQYPDFATWQQSEAVVKELTGQREWWQNHLAGYPSLHQLPTDRPRPAKLTQNGDSLRFQFDSQTTQNLQALAHSSGATLFMVVLAAFKVLLAKYSGQTDILVGTPIANRNRRDVEPLIGFFANTLVLRDQLNHQDSFQTFLQTVKHNTLNSFAHQDVPFEKVVDLLQPERQTSYSPLFQIMFMMQNTPASPLNVPNLDIQMLPDLNQLAKFDLSLETRETPQGLATQWRFNTDLFDKETIARMATHFAQLVEHVLAEPSKPLNHVSLLDEAEQDFLIEQVNQTQYPLPYETPMHQFLENWAQTDPQRLALTAADGETWSYEALNQRANQIAWYLIEQGVGLDDRVALFVQRCPEMIAAIFGVLKAGAAYVPIDPEYPEQRWGMMLEDSCPKVILTTKLLAPTLEKWDRVCLEDLLANPKQSSNPNQPFSPDQAMFFIYTSGTSGKPKASVNRHRGMVNYNLWHQHCFPLQPHDRVGLKTPFGFDVASWETFWPFVAGASLVIAKPGTSGDPFYLREWMRSHQVTSVYFVPSMLRAFLDSLGQEPFDSALKYLFTGGEALTSDIQSDTLAAMSGPQGPLEIHNVYGPSEASLRSAYFSCGTAPRTGRIPIGTSLLNTKAFVMDPRLQLQPCGLPGELNVAGVHLSRGYWGKPGLTAERFVPNPFAKSLDENRLYRTGDLVRRRTCGILDYLGRVDAQVKLRGMRIELSDIEAQIISQQHIHQAKVLLHKTPKTQILVAFVEGDNLQEDSFFQNLRHQLHQCMPAYMVPSHFIAIETWPYLPNGKCHMRQLEAMAEESCQHLNANRYVAPRNDVERELCEIWQTVLGLEKVGVEDNFFEIGGHSLLATQILSRVRQAFPLPLSLAFLFDQPTISAVATALENITQSLAQTTSVSEDEEQEDFEF